MKILFLFFNITQSGSNEYYYAGLGYIISALKQYGYQVELIEVRTIPDKSYFLNRLKSVNPDLVGISAITLQWKYVKIIAAWIKEYSNIPIICGGTHATTSPEEVIADQNIDMVCIGEGEYPMLDLASKMEKGEDYTDIANLWVKTPRGEVIKNSPRKLIQDLDSLSFPDIETVDYEHLLNYRDYTVCLGTGRGCAYHCSFCLNTYMKKLFKGHGNFIRRHSPKYVIDYIESIRKLHTIKRVFFEDEDFISTMAWLEEFCGLYNRAFDFPFGIMTNVTRVNKDKLDMLHKAGCRWIIFAVETGNESLRKNILNKPFSDREIIDAFRLTKVCGIKPYAFVMVGIPRETRKMLEETEEFLKQIRPGHTFVTTFFPIPKTPLWDLVEKEGYLSDRSVNTITMAQSVLDLPTISAEDIENGFHRLLRVKMAALIDSTATGYLSLSREFHEGRAVFTDAQLIIEYWKIWIDYFPAIVFRENGSVSFKVNVKPGSRLVFTCGYFLEQELVNEGTTITQYVRAGNSETDLSDVFRKEYDIGNNSGTRLLTSEAIVDLPGIDGETAIVLGIEQVQPKNSGIVSLFSNPCLIQQ